MKKLRVCLSIGFIIMIIMILLKSFSINIPDHFMCFGYGVGTGLIIVGACTYIFDMEKIKNYKKILFKKIR